MKKPKRVDYNKNRETSTFRYTNPELDEEFYMRGAVYWPEGNQGGFALIAAQSIENKRINIIEQMGFLTIENILNEDQSLEYHGLGNMFNKCWSRYWASKYFWLQDEKVHKAFRLEVIRSPMVDPNPLLINIESPLDDNQLIHKYQRSRKLVFEEGSELHNQLELLKSDEKAKLPAVCALKRLLAGYERYPFRNHHVEEDLGDY